MRKAFISPSKYVQGENELLNLGYYVSTFGKSALLIAHPADACRRLRVVYDIRQERGLEFEAVQMVSNVVCMLPNEASNE